MVGALFSILGLEGDCPTLSQVVAAEPEVQRGADDSDAAPYQSGERAESMTGEQAVRFMRDRKEYDPVIRGAYLRENVRAEARRFEKSSEFFEVRNVLGRRIENAVAVDLGAGAGIGAFALARAGARMVVAIEPELSSLVGCRAINSIGLATIKVLSARGEGIPLSDGAVDVVYGRQVLHHTRSLEAAIAECARVLKPGGVFLGCREHVADNEQQLQDFLDHHPVHQLAGGEYAFPLKRYISGFRSAGLLLERVWGPWETLMNAYPYCQTPEELETLHRLYLLRRFGPLASMWAGFPGVKAVCLWWLKRPRPGRLFSFLAVKKSGRGPLS
ncbi:MAG: methyltransferase domain-containing protein [Acidobacteriota bacterium]